MRNQGRNVEQIKTFLAPDLKAIEDLVHLSQRLKSQAQTLVEFSDKMLEIANMYQRQHAELGAMYSKYEGEPNG